MAFINLEAMVQTMTAWYTSGAYDMEPLDQELMATIQHTTNPGLDSLADMVW
jgi:hypothetical protein